MRLTQTAPNQLRANAPLNQPEAQARDQRSAATRAGARFSAAKTCPRFAWAWHPGSKHAVWSRGCGVVTVVLAVGAWSAVLVRGQETRPVSATQPVIRFTAVDVFVDSGEQPLAAYQFEFAAEVGGIKIVGIEGGEHSAFAEPPYYDEAAMNHDRAIIAAFNTGRDLPRGKTRIARLHLQITGGPEPQYAVKLDVAGSTDGSEIEAVVTVSQGANE